MSYPAQDLSPEIHQLIDAIVHVFARKNVPALVVLPANDFASARAAFSQRLELLDCPIPQTVSKWVQ